MQKQEFVACKTVTDPGQLLVSLFLSKALALKQTHTFICHLPTLSGWLLCVSNYQHILILPSWNNNMAGTQTTQQNWACSGIRLDTNSDVGFDDVWLFRFHSWLNWELGILLLLKLPNPRMESHQVWKLFTLTPSSGRINVLHYPSNTLEHS